MRLLSYEVSGRRTFGVVQGDAVTELASPEAPTLRVALERWGIEGLRRRPAGAPTPLSAIRWLQPVPDPEKILCVGLNYHLHAQEAGMAIPKHPSIFVRFPGAQVGHLEPVVRPRASEQFDYEAELAVVIGRRARHVPEAKAMEYVAGYSCFAENSIRDWQKHAAQATPGKNFQATGAFGPWITTPDEAGPVENMRVIGRLNGQEMQNDSAGNMIFSVPQMIAYMSTFIELVPGDVIVTGTPAGVGLGKKPPLWMKPGDVFEVECTGVGVLRNTVIDER